MALYKTMTTQPKHEPIFGLLVAACLLLPTIFSSCSDKLVADSSNDHHNVVLRASLTPPASMVSMDSFNIKVTAVDMVDVYDTLSFDGRWITGALEVPSGEARRFELTIEHFDIESGTELLLYRGVAVADIGADSETSLAISLRPEVPLVKLSPRWVQVDGGAVLEADLKVYNLDNLARLEAAISHVPPNSRPVIKAVAATLPESLAPAANLTYYQHADSSNFQVAVAGSGGQLLVDTNGDATLATLTLATRADIYPTSLYVPLIFDSLMAVTTTGDTIPSASIFFEELDLRFNRLPDRELFFPDALLRQAVLRQAGLSPSTDPILLSSVIDLTTLDFTDEAVSNLAGLEALANISLLSGASAALSDLQSLASLQHLDRLELEFNNVSDLTPLSELPLLTYLDLQANDLTDISPLANLKTLQYLDLGSNNISDIAALANLPAITDLALAVNQITNIQPLVQNEALGAGVTIYLHDNPLDATSVDYYVPILRDRGALVFLTNPGKSPPFTGE